MAIDMVTRNLMAVPDRTYTLANTKFIDGRSSALHIPRSDVSYVPTISTKNSFPPILVEEDHQRTVHAMYDSLLSKYIKSLQIISDRLGYLDRQSLNFITDGIQGNCR